MICTLPVQYKNTALSTAVSIIHSLSPYLSPFLLLFHLSSNLFLTICLHTWCLASHLSHVCWVVFIFLCFRHRRPFQLARSLLAVSTPSHLALCFTSIYNWSLVFVLCLFHLIILAFLLFVMYVLMELLVLRCGNSNLTWCVLHGHDNIYLKKMWPEHSVVWIDLWCHWLLY